MTEKNMTTQEIFKCIVSGKKLNLSEISVQLKSEMVNLSIELMADKEAARIVIKDIDSFNLKGKERDEFIAQVLQHYTYSKASDLSPTFGEMLDFGFVEKRHAVDFANLEIQDTIFEKHGLEPLASFSRLIEHGILDPDERAFKFENSKHIADNLPFTIALVRNVLIAENAEKRVTDTLNEFVNSFKEHSSITEESDYLSRIEELCELAVKNKKEFFEQDLSSEVIADVVQHLFEYGTEDHIFITYEAIKRGILTNLRECPGEYYKLTIAEIWESTAYAQVLRIAGWKCDKDSDPEGKDFMARMADPKDRG